MALKVLIVDDEALARSRLRTLLGDCTEGLVAGVQEAADAVAALAALQWQPFDLVLLDIHMPGMDGMALAERLARHHPSPSVVFVTAHAEHAVRAFELDAVDYLTKPVRRERLQQALTKVQRLRAEAASTGNAAAAEAYLVIQERGRTERVPVADVLYLKAELKYITVRTERREYLYVGSLSDLEQRYAQRFVRVHRNALVARDAVRALEKVGEGADGEGWAVRLGGIDERLAVSRRQLAAVREALAG